MQYDSLDSGYQRLGVSEGSMLDLKFVASIAERDIDLLVLEELSVSTEF